LLTSGPHTSFPTPSLFPATQINRINVDILHAAYTELCIALRPNAACTTMERLCGNKLCTYAIFDTPFSNDYKCCPVRSWADTFV
jgi:hypothetical protein